MAKSQRWEEPNVKKINSKTGGATPRSRVIARGSMGNGETKPRIGHLASLRSLETYRQDPRDAGIILLRRAGASCCTRREVFRELRASSRTCWRQPVPATALR